MHVRARATQDRMKIRSATYHLGRNLQLARRMNLGGKPHSFAADRQLRGGLSRVVCYEVTGTKQARGSAESILLAHLSDRSCNKAANTGKSQNTKTRGNKMTKKKGESKIINDNTEQSLDGKLLRA